jgi:hypothetical protein
MHRPAGLLHRIGLLCTLLAGCAGSGEGLDNNGRPIGSEGGGGPLTATFQSIQDNVFTPICSVCHAGGAAPQGLRLDAANSYAMIVDIPSVEVPSLLRISPGNPDASYLVQKIEGHAAVGAQMPFGGPPLPAATIATIRQWVSDGAPPAVAASGARALAVASVAPALGDVVLERPASIVVGFTHEIDVTRLDAAAARIERFTTEPGAAGTAVVPATLSVPAHNARALLIVPRAPLPNGRYRLVVTDDPASGLFDVSGARLRPPNPAGTLTEFAVEAAP